VNHSCGLIKTSSEFLFFVLPPLVLLKGQTVMQIMRQNIIGCGLQVLQSAKCCNRSLGVPRWHCLWWHGILFWTGNCVAQRRRRCRVS
ncbi:MAG: hypothetical protein ACYT04_45120, partial [Nostoc sp.]